MSPPPGRRSGPENRPAATSPNTAERILPDPTNDPRQAARQDALIARRETGLALLAGDLRAGCSEIRAASARGDIDETRRRQLILDAVADLEVAAVHRAGRR